MRLRRVWKTHKRNTICVWSHAFAVLSRFPFTLPRIVARVRDVYCAVAQQGGMKEKLSKG